MKNIDFECTTSVCATFFFLIQCSSTSDNWIYFQNVVHVYLNEFYIMISSCCIEVFQLNFCYDAHILMTTFIFQILVERHGSRVLSTPAASWLTHLGQAIGETTWHFGWVMLIGPKELINALLNQRLPKNTSCYYCTRMSFYWGPEWSFYYAETESVMSANFVSSFDLKMHAIPLRYRWNEFMDTCLA